MLWSEGGKELEVDVDPYLAPLSSRYEAHDAVGLSQFSENFESNVMYVEDPEAGWMRQSEDAFSTLKELLLELTQLLSSYR